jgi:hypothetical protein
MIKYFLSVDCALKTFAYCIVKVDSTNFDYVTKKIGILCQILEHPKKINAAKYKELALIYEKLDLMVRGYIVILAGDVVNLTDKEHTISQIKALSDYCKMHIMPIMRQLPPQVNVIIEFQMGQNNDSGLIMIAFAALFIDYNCIIVGPSLKNKIYFSEEGRLSNFISKYSSSHYANKAHAAFNFKLILPHITSAIRPLKNSEVNHMADSFLQIFGYINYGDDIERF